MRKNQWFVLGFAFLLLMNWFIIIDNGFNCINISDIEKPLGEGDIWECVNSEIYDPFIYIFAVLWIVCWINGGLEYWAEKRRK